MHLDPLLAWQQSRNINVNLVAKDPQGKAANIESLSRPTSTQPIQEYEGQIDQKGKATSILV